MFIGHYAVSYVAKAVKPSLPLWLLFLAVQLVDVFWAMFVLLGIENVRIVPGITASSPLDLYYMPYTHGLLTSLLWAGAALVLYRLACKRKLWAGAIILGAAVFSHWLLDFLVHRPDLPIYDNTLKVGLGLWNYPVLSFLLEAGLLLGGIYFYLQRTRSVQRGGVYGMLIFGLCMMAAQLSVFFAVPPETGTEVAISALVSYFLFAAVALWLERKRVAVTRSANDH